MMLRVELVWSGVVWMVWYGCIQGYPSLETITTYSYSFFNSLVKGVWGSLAFLFLFSGGCVSVLPLQCGHRQEPF